MATTLLAIDDSVTMRKVLEMTFAGEDFRVVTAESADAALAKAVHKNPAQRTEALSELVEDLRRPNAEYLNIRKRPLLERNPTAFWRAIAIALLLLNLFLLYRVSR